MEKKFRKEVMENFRTMKVEELKAQTKHIQEELSSLEFKLKSGQTDQLGNVRRAKKNIARLHTILQEKTGASK